MRRHPSILAETSQYTIRMSNGNGPMARRQWSWLMDLAATLPNPTPPAPAEARQEQPAQKTG